MPVQAVTFGAPLHSPESLTEIGWFVPRFLGREYDRSTGFFVDGPRVYDPLSHTYANVDANGELADGENPYVFEDNNPLQIPAAPKRDVPWYDHIDRLFAGFANAISLGGMNKVREWLYGAGATMNHEGWAYNLGTSAGVVHSLALGGAAALAGRANWATRSVQAYMTVGDAVGVAQSSQAVYNSVAQGAAYDWTSSLGFLPTVGWMAGASRRGGKASANAMRAHFTNPTVSWVDEAASMGADARLYNSGAQGARSNVATRLPQAPSIPLTGAGSARVVRFDGESPGVLIDRKLAVVTTKKSQNQALRQSAALRQNNLRGLWEVPDDAQAARARAMFEKLGIDNIDVNVVPR